MAGNRKDCIDEILEAVKHRLRRSDVERHFEAIDDAAQGYEAGGMDRREAIRRAAREAVERMGEAKAIAMRQDRINALKQVERDRFYAKAPTPIEAMEAKLVGVNKPFAGSRKSIENRAGQLEEKWAGGMVQDLEREGLDKLFASRAIEKEWTRELFELNRGRDGAPGVTRNPQALKVAQLVRKWQRASIDQLNREGAWVKSYSGYITKTSHDPMRLRKAADQSLIGKGGTEADRAAWVDDVMRHGDMRKTFGSAPLEAQREMLGKIWAALKDGEHFLEEEPTGEVRFANVAKQASAHREIHFKNADAWLAYNAKYGSADATQTVMEAFRKAARRTALMQEFGTRPREAFERDMAQLKTLAQKAGRIDEWRTWEAPLRNRYNQLDGSANKPGNELVSRLAGGWMAIQRMAKLGRVPFTHIASLPTKALALRYLGVPFADRYRTMFSGMFRGLRGSDKREVAELLSAGADARIHYIMSRYDVSDKAPGVLSRMEARFFKMTGISALTENQRADAEVIMARHLGMRRGQDWGELDAHTQRLFTLYGLGEADWRALNKADWASFGGAHGEPERTYLTPDVAHKLSDEQIKDLINDRVAATGRGLSFIRPEDIAKARDDLADSIHGLYYDQGRYAIFAPSARTRAVLMQGTQQNSPNLATALRLLYQFRVWPAEMIMRTWGRMIYGGDATAEKIAGITELVAGSILFGTAAEALRETVQGQDPTARMEARPLAYLTRGLVRSGAGTIAGDYLFGEFDRHGQSILASLAGPTFGQLEMLNQIKADVVAGKWSQASAELLHAARSNAPFVDLWWTFRAFDHLVTYRVLDMINPGYSKRYERTMKEKQGIEFWLHPSRTAGGLAG